MTWTWSRFWLTVVVGLVVLALYHLMFRRFGRVSERVVDRVVEETSAESSKIRSLVDQQHAATLRHKSELSSLNEEVARLRALTAAIEPLKADLGKVTAELALERAKAAQLAVGREPQRAAAVPTATQSSSPDDGSDRGGLAVAATEFPQRSQRDEALDVRDDFLLIEGIGPKMNSALATSGITTFRALAEADEHTLRAALQSANLSVAPSLATWGAQAKFLADGDRDGFDAYVARLVAGRESGR